MDVEDSPPDAARVFSVRIVDIDYYMSPPIPETDICYSSFQGGKVNEVPVIRIFGSTPAGQKTCLHIHKALPYLYVPCSEIQLNAESQKGDKDIIAHALEKALKLKGKVGSNRQHVHACNLVRARKLYGYFSTEELFVKIYLYHPQDVARAANFLLGGAVLDRSLQPHEAHIPFILQFLVDYNLYGMGFIHVSKAKFRHPIPDTFTQRSSVNRLTEMLNSSPHYSKADSPIWVSSTVPVNWMWHVPEASSSSCGSTTGLVKRISTCKLEGDSTTDDILNQQTKVFLSQSRTSSDVKMVQSLIPIWEEEHERTDLHDAYRDLPPDPGKPCQADVLKILALGSEMQKSITELFRAAGTSIDPLNEDVKLVRPMSFANDMGMVNEVGNASFYTGDTNQCGGSVDTENEKMEFTDMTGLPGSGCIEHCTASEDRNKNLLSKQIACDATLTPKSDEEILGVLKWLASSQAAEDINSDDELLRETILSPLLPATSIKTVLEKASDDYESASKLECQDILSTIEAVDDFNKVTENLELIDGIQTLVAGIPKVDGSFDDCCYNPCRNSSSDFNSAESSQRFEELNKSRSTANHTSTRQWGILPLSIPENAVDILDREAKPSGSMTKNSNFNVPVSSGPVEGCCSLRDLMRKKRSHRASSLERETIRPKRVFDAEGNTNRLLVTNSEPLSHKGCHDTESLGSSDLKPPTKYRTCVTEQHDVNPSSHFKPTSTFENSSQFEVNTNADGRLNIPDPESFSNNLAAGIKIVPKNVVLQDTSTPTFEDHIRGSVKLISDPQTYVNELSQDAEPLLDGYPSNDIKRQVCHLREIGINGNCGGDLSLRACRGSNVPMGTGSCGDEHCEMTSSAVCRSLPLLDAEGEHSDVGKMALHDMSEPEEAREGNSLDECFSQVVKDSLDEMEGPNTYSGMDDDPLCREEPLPDVNPHHCIHGTDVYLLTPASAPPTADSVYNWVAKLGASTHSFEEQLIDGHANSCARPDMDNSNEEDRENQIMVVDAGGKEEKKALVRDAENTKKVANNGSQDFSQLSGPYGKSTTTPLSQTGFRDPASFGCGQQLTLLSLEILAESRGDLRPDPRYDAIKVLAFAVKDDNEPVASLYALLHTPELNERNHDGLYRYNILHFTEERHLFYYFVDFIISWDPDVFLGWDIQGGSLGFLTERASQLGISLLNKISRTPSEAKMDINNSKGLDQIFHDDVLPEQGNVDSVLLDSGPIEDEWGRTHASGIHVDGRVILNVWRLMRNEVKLTMYTIEAVTEAVLRRKVSFISNRVLASWFSSGPTRARYRSIEFVVERAKLNLEIMDQLDMINRTSELARVFGIEFFSVLSRGSQYRVESMLMRLAHSQNFIAISPGSQQVATQPAMECLPLVMEPKSGFYSDPVIVLDFQSLYPSMIIAYNLCFCTCLGKLAPPKPNVLGVSSYSPEVHVLHKLKDQLLLTPNGVLYVPPEVRKGVLPRLLEEILSTRIMVKQAMKKLDTSQKVLQRIFNSRQLALKLISNVTYGYTAAGFSGRMPCAELADSIVQCGRRTLETAISFVNANDTWKAKVIYGDTDSLFVLLEGRTVEEAFRIGKEIAAEVTRMNPDPVTLKMEKVYHPCFLLTKKRYVGYSYESRDQTEPIFDAKGIETVRRDTCGAVAKTMEQSLRLYFENQDISKVKAYLQRQWKRIISGRVSLQDFVFAKEVRLGTYSTRNPSSLPPAAIVATKAMRMDPRAEPRYGERTPYIVVHGDPGARLVDMVVDPFDLLALDSPFRLNDHYYINKQIIPALQRVFGLVGADLSRWLSEIPRPNREAFGKRQLHGSNSFRARIDHYYLSKHCVLCGELAQSSKHFCETCSKNKTAMATSVIRKTSKLEKDMQHLAEICRHCGGGDWLVEPGVKCTSLACSVFYERRKVQKGLVGMAAVATESGLYPKCIAELF